MCANPPRHYRRRMLTLTDDELRSVNAGIDDLEELLFKVHWHADNAERKISELLESRS